MVHLDVAENSFISIPICALRMEQLQLLDLSNNSLSDLPQDMDRWPPGHVTRTHACTSSPSADPLCVCRLQQLESLFLHKNQLTYLPHCLCNIATLSMIVVSGDDLVCIPTRLCSNPDIKYTHAHRSKHNISHELTEGKETKKFKLPLVAQCGNCSLVGQVLNPGELLNIFCIS